MLLTSLEECQDVAAVAGFLLLMNAWSNVSILCSEGK
jgi:hypothetical protein